MRRLILGTTALFCLAAAPNPVLDLTNTLLPLAGFGFTQRSLPAKLAEMVTPADFLQPGQTEAQLRTGQIDAEPALAAYMAAPLTAHIPCGTYSVQHALPPIARNGQAFVGAGELCVQLRVDFAAGDVISFQPVNKASPGTLLWDAVQLGGWTLTAGVPHTAGVALDLDYFHDLRLSRFRVLGPWGEQVSVHGGGTYIAHIDHFLLGTQAALATDMTGSCIHLTGYPIDTYISEGNTTKCGGSAALLVDDGSGLYLHDLDLVYSAGDAVQFNVASGDNFYSLMADNVLTDSTVGNGWNFTGAGAITELQMTNIWAASSGSLLTSGGLHSGATAKSGIFLNAPMLNGLTLTNAHALNNGAYGLEILWGTNLTISTSQVFHNSTISYNGSGGCSSTTTIAGMTYPLLDGIYLSGNPNNVMLIGNMSGQGGSQQVIGNLPNCQRYGLYALGGAPLGQAITVMGNIFNHNQTGGHALPANTAPNKIVDLGNTDY